MDQFHWIVLIIAVVLLIILLTAAAMMLRHQNSEEIFPKTYGKCPDGWKYSEKYNKCFGNEPRDNSVSELPVFDSKNYKIYGDYSGYTELETTNNGDRVAGGARGYLIYDPGYNEVNKVIQQNDDNDTDRSAEGYYETINADNPKNFYAARFKPDASRCDLKKWAEYHKIKWDGITNYNNC